MKKITYLNGSRLYKSLLSGYDSISKEVNYLNDINVFPVADGDTGNNMASTFLATLSLSDVSDSLTKTLNDIADRALSGARGNSGIIIAQFINSLAGACDGKEAVNTQEFAVAVNTASVNTYNAIAEPKEGTILTVMRAWVEEIHRQSHLTDDFCDLFTASLKKVQDALKETTNQMELLKKSKVVDAGAHGFVSFLEELKR